LIVLSHYQAQQLIKAKGKKSEIELSLDLERTKVKVQIGECVYLTDGESVTWKTVEDIAKKENACYSIENGEANPIQTYSEAFGRVYTLYPTESAPTMLVSGIPMHRIKDTDPWKDTLNKMKAFGPVGGHILDTTTGLGYTAIMAAKNSANVISVEIDPAAREIAKQNPWSQDLFNNPRIELIIGDSSDLIHEFDKNSLNGIIHDPPMFSLAGELYSLSFYEQAHQVLKTNGRMFHYIGNPDSTSGKRVTRGAVQRLKNAGFRKVLSKPKAFGVLAYA